MSLLFFSDYIYLERTKPKPFPLMPLPPWSAWLPVAAYVVSSCAWHPSTAANLSSCLFYSLHFLPQWQSDSSVKRLLPLEVVKTDFDPSLYIGSEKQGKKKRPTCLQL